MRRLSLVMILGTLLATAACGTVGRFAGDPRRTSLPQNLSKDLKPHAVAVCYNGNSTTREALDAAARELCKEPDSTVQFLREDLNLNDCPLVKKRRAVFICTPPP
ncbi:MAG: hypothetical protein MJE12_04330 [Alphaproteobacteria bacterium]|nr:hypothetical protein [Alphaproteobacteria bacterium]